jgi:hypothetical protein
MRSSARAGRDVEFNTKIVNNKSECDTVVDMAEEKSSRELQDAR